MVHFIESLTGRRRKAPDSKIGCKEGFSVCSLAKQGIRYRVMGQKPVVESFRKACFPERNHQ